VTPNSINYDKMKEIDILENSQKYYIEFFNNLEKEVFVVFFEIK